MKIKLGVSRYSSRLLQNVSLSRNRETTNRTYIFFDVNNVLREDEAG